MSKPTQDRPVYQELLKRDVRSILEVGIGVADRSVKMIEAAACPGDVRQVSYCGVDLFEARRRADGPGLSLKAAHQKLASTGARVRLVPGNAFSGIARVANQLTQVDLVLISGCQPRELLDQAWFYFPRMLHDRAVVYLQKPCRAGESTAYDRVPADEIAIWAGRTRRSRAA